ncbi:NDR1/HIN1-Like protein 3 [Nymphaea thermarum]|nr:NDR1/HIN1-Like protein 3 [Nymphaea thermarum]
MAGGTANSRDMSPGSRHHRRRVLRCIAVTALSIIVLIGLAVLIIWLVVQPSNVAYTLENAKVSNFNLSSQKLNATFALDMKVRNPNKRIEIAYESIDVTVWYDDQTIALGSISGFVQPRRNTTKLDAVAVADATPLQTKAWNDMKQQNSSKHEIDNVEVRLMSEVRFKVGLWKSKKYRLKVSCWIKALPLGSSSRDIDRIDCDAEI